MTGFGLCYGDMVRLHTPRLDANVNNMVRILAQLSMQPEPLYYVEVCQPQFFAFAFRTPALQCIVALFLRALPFQYSGNSFNASNGITIHDNSLDSTCSSTFPGPYVKWQVG